MLRIVISYEKTVFNIYTVFFLSYFDYSPYHKRYKKYYYLQAATIIFNIIAKTRFKPFMAAYQFISYILSCIKKSLQKEHFSKYEQVYQSRNCT